MDVLRCKVPELVRRELTRGEPSHLIDRCRELEDEYPIPATPQQEYALRASGGWTPGMTKHDARRRMARLFSS
jgi:hypothetical protein